MRLLFGWLAVLLGAVSIALAARYGYKGAKRRVFTGDGGAEPS